MFWKSQSLANLNLNGTKFADGFRFADTAFLESAMADPLSENAKEGTFVKEESDINPNNLFEDNTEAAQNEDQKIVQSPETVDEQKIVDEQTLIQEDIPAETEQSEAQTEPLVQKLEISPQIETQTDGPEINLDAADMDFNKYLDLANRVKNRGVGKRYSREEADEIGQIAGKTKEKMTKIEQWFSNKTADDR